MPVGTEIERKFLLDELPAALAFARRTAILQGYLALDGDTEVRVRRTPAGATLTIKHGGGEVRVVEELALGERQADALWQLTEDRRLQKTRRIMHVDGLEVSVDEYFGELDGLIVAEVEFDDEDAARAFMPPAWFGREVTGEAAYANRTLSVDGLPREDHAA
ncbi:MAG TPA: CYTH domain-containing protein [Solirubrobacteraceae bacterium]|nr:CYTH domain-containing protein [Solirubrobacteraceae bacterium]